PQIVASGAFAQAPCSAVAASPPWPRLPAPCDRVTGMTVRKAHATTLAVPLIILALSGCEAKGRANDSVAPSPSASVVAPAAPNAAMGKALREGDAAPDVDLLLQDGRKVKLSSLQGQFIAIYFYPKDETQGCTIEAQNFRDRFDDLKKTGMVVIG